MANGTTVDFDHVAFRKNVVGEIEKVNVDVRAAASRFDVIVDQLESIWTTEGGKQRVQKLRTAKQENYVSLMNQISDDLNRLHSVAGDLTKMYNS